MSAVLSVTSGILLVVGSLLAMLAGLGVLRFPDPLSRLQAATKLQAAGVGLVLVAAALVAEDGGELAVLGLIVLALIITVPVLSQVVARAAYRRGGEREP
ncbi:MAG TPA: monovalent cation/H(+) antiporter subunit G [Pseudonocardia sp.]|nr:monovalent cation/H(+) antiporter subunit G [Pseudonocardia sp.]